MPTSGIIELKTPYGQINNYITYSRELLQILLTGFGGQTLNTPHSQYLYKDQARGRTGLMVRASDSRSGDPGSILGRVGVFVSLSKRHLLPKKYW